MKKLLVILMLLSAFTLEEQLVAPTWEAGPKNVWIKKGGETISTDPIMYEVIKSLQDLMVRVGKLEKK